MKQILSAMGSACFYCSISKLPDLLKRTGVTDRQTSTHIIDARSNTLLYFHSLLLFPTLREPQGPHSRQQKLASAVTALWVESQIITSPIGLDSDTKGWAWGRGGGYGGGFFFLSLPPLPIFLSSSSSPPPPSFVYFQFSILLVSAILTGAIFLGPSDWWRVSHSGDSFECTAG